jgi:mediator of RNA polymerase II transcription subunit 24
VIIQPGITCRFKPEEEMIAGSVLSLAHWLLQCYHHHSLGHNTTDNSELLTKPANLLDHMLRKDFTTAMLYLAKHEQKDLYLQVTKIKFRRDFFVDLSV